MLVVVVLPCVPAMPMPVFERISSASITGRPISGTRRRCASRVSAFSPTFTADE